MDRVGEVLRRKLFRQPVDSRAPAGILSSSPQLIQAAMNAQATPIVQQSQLDNLSSLAASAPAAQPTQIETPPGSGVGVVGVDTPPAGPGEPGGDGVVGGGGGPTNPALTTEVDPDTPPGAGTGPSLTELISAASDRESGTDTDTDTDTSTETSDSAGAGRAPAAATAGSKALTELLSINERIKNAGTKAEKKKAANEARELLTEMGIDAKDIRTDKNLNLMMFGLTLASTPGSFREGVVEAGKQTLGSFAAGKAAEQKGRRELDLAAVKMGTADVTAAQSRLSKRAEQLTGIIKEEIKANKDPEKLRIAKELMASDPVKFPDLASALAGVNARLEGAESQARDALIASGVPAAEAALLARSPSLIEALAKGETTIEELRSVIAGLAGEAGATSLDGDSTDSGTITLE